MWLLALSGLVSSQISLVIKNYCEKKREVQNKPLFYTCW